jgi:hypothetical protein
MFASLRGAFWFSFYGVLWWLFFCGFGVFFALCFWTPSREKPFLRLHWKIINSSLAQYGTSAYLIIRVFTHCFVLSICHLTFFTFTLPHG